MTAQIGRASALLLAAVFAWAGLAKAGRRRETATSFTAFGLPAVRTLALIVPLAEVAVAAALVAVPPVGASAALALLAVFTAVIIRALATGVTVPCACFGSSETGRAVSSLDLVRNAFLAAAAVLATGAPTNPSLWAR